MCVRRPVPLVACAGATKGCGESIWREALRGCVAQRCGAGGAAKSTRPTACLDATKLVGAHLATRGTRRASVSKSSFVFGRAAQRALALPAQGGVARGARVQVARRGGGGGVVRCGVQAAHSLGRYVLHSTIYGTYVLLLLVVPSK